MAKQGSGKAWWGQGNRAESAGKGVKARGALGGEWPRGGHWGLPFMTCPLCAAHPRSPGPASRQRPPRGKVSLGPSSMAAPAKPLSSGSARPLHHSPSQGPDCDTGRALSHHPDLETSGTGRWGRASPSAHFLASAQCWGGLPTAPSEQCPLLPENPLSPTSHLLLHGGTCASGPCQALVSSPIRPRAHEHPEGQTQARARWETE